ncbi:phosphohistidine phosphatase, SixA [Oceanospirillum multiglobuliferum]|uniref:Phosphohistidine phosphatase SixA n=1 Tax=Oceanospirillum multiglobuliferum TaxID=64969 RepID=A0A1T4N238_9GAMM|nr:phosphohistidine phosphatase SixA [Oceanospirillum multiglobuliferum]OPX55810.1 phosphohistidine phosphatase SixA [Oceanospirillum multiglobuliferum]SJZ73399.1 phosphohistidine phosphatase, SixA [Oceanospirillum multiglobuliferum]
MKLIIVRHGEAGVAATDPERALTANGRQQVQRITQAMKDELIGSIAYASPYLRAQQTLELISQGLGEQDGQTLAFITPDDAPEPVLSWLALQSDACLMLVSHQPLVSRLISLLVDGVESAAYPMDTASIAILEADVWAKGLARLVSLTHVVDLD